jgi:hypothetical protein
VGLAAALREKIEGAIRSRDEAIDAGSDKDRDHHGRVLNFWLARVLS